MAKDLGRGVLFLFLFGILLFLSAIPCGLGLLVTLPMLYLISALAYRDMIGIPGLPRARRAVLRGAAAGRVAAAAERRTGPAGLGPGAAGQRPAGDALSKMAVRFGLVLLGVLAVLLPAARHWYALGQDLGLAAGVLFYLYGVARGGALGNARRFERRPADVHTRLGVLLAAMGIAVGAIGHDPPFPLSFRVFYGVIAAIAAVAALTLAARARP